MGSVWRPFLLSMCSTAQAHRFRSYILTNVVYHYPINAVVPLNLTGTTTSTLEASAGPVGAMGSTGTCVDSGDFVE